MDTKNWYRELRKPTWAPPSSVFGPVWSVLYVIIAVTFGMVFYKTWRGELSFMVALPFILNLIFNFLYTPIQFGLKSNFLASIDILLVLGTLVWAGILLSEIAELRYILYLNIPYFLWVTFATCLQLTITYLNRI